MACLVSVANYMPKSNLHFPITARLSLHDCPHPSLSHYLLLSVRFRKLPMYIEPPPLFSAHLWTAQSIIGGTAEENGGVQHDIEKKKNSSDEPDSQSDSAI